MVRPPAARAHSPPDARPAAPRDRAGHRRRRSCAGCSSGSTWRPARRRRGERGTLEVLRQLQGFEAPANAWEPQLLARRIAGYDPAVARSAVPDRRGRLGPAVAASGDAEPPSTTASRHGRAPQAPASVIPTSVAPITFFVREDADWMPPAPADASADGDAGTRAARRAPCCRSLQRAGASFFADLVRGTQLLEVGSRGGAVGARRRRTRHRRRVRQPARAHRSAPARGPGIRPRRRGRATARDAGRCCTRPMPLDRRGAARARPAACCCGATASSSASCSRARSMLPTWRELLMTFRRLEDRGEVRGGRFVSGFIGEQFALPVAVESLRAARRGPASPAGRDAHRGRSAESGRRSSSRAIAWPPTPDASSRSGMASPKRATPARRVLRFQDSAAS